MRVYTFGDGAAEGSGTMTSELGGKGAGLADMCRIGVPVPAGFTISTEACRSFYRAEQTFPDILADEIERGLQHIEEITGRVLGDPENPLLVSVRSGAAISMPGMMDTILNVGLNRGSIEGLQKAGTDDRFAYDSYRRFLEMFSEIALDVDPAFFSSVRDEVLSLTGFRSVEQLTAEWHNNLARAYENALEQAGVWLPEDPRAQLRLAIIGVFRSWNTPRAVRFRRANHIPNDLGTAVTIQSMVFGNLDAASATGVAFSRDPNTGEPGLFGEYLPQAQGEDVVSGRFTPRPIFGGEHCLSKIAPEACSELVRISALLESHHRTVQDLEFTVERGKLWMLQTRSAKCSVRASVRTAVDMVEEGLISREEAVRRIEPEDLTRLLHPSVDVQAHRLVIARGLPASPGAVSGTVVFNPDEAIERSGNGESIILVRVETSADDMEAIRVATGVLTSRGGMTSHAALVARGLGRPCVTGCSGIVVDERKGRFRVRNGSVMVNAGTQLTIDGSTGEVILGEVATQPANPPEAFNILMGWADRLRTVGVRGNADTAAAITEAYENGADGIGLCSTEHMFLDEEHLGLVREMVLAYDAPTRRRVIEHILPVQRRDFASVFQATGDRPIAIRLLDLPLHELMPEERADLGSVAARLETTVDQLANRARLLRPSNPVLGHRGCRLGLTFPELYEVQVRAVFEALADTETRPDLEFVIPLVTCAEEMRRLRKRINQMAQRVCDERQIKVPEFRIGAMLETPRACLSAGAIAEHADFILFGTTDLTLTTYAIHRDDAGRYLPFYVDNGVLPHDPFVKLDDTTVGELIRIAVRQIRQTKPGMRCGLGGGHANDPETVLWCCDNAIDYVTCAPHRLPIVRLAAGQVPSRGVFNP